MSRFVPYPSAPPGPPPINAPPPSYAFSGPGIPHRPLPPQTHADYPRPHSLPQSNDHRLAVYMNNIASMVQAQPREIVEALAPHFASIRAEIDSLKTSIDRVQTGSAKVREDVSKVRQDVSRISSDVSNIGETLSTVVRAQQANVAANSSNTPRRGQANTRDPIPSTDVEMTDNAVRYETQAEPNSNVRTTPAHLSTPSPIRDALSADSATSRQWDAGPAPGRFSKSEWGMQVPAPSQSAPALTCQSPLLPHANEISSPHLSIPGHSNESLEVQQLPSPPEIQTLSQSEEAFVQSQLQPDSQSQSPSTRHQQQAETPVRPVNVERRTLLSGSVSSSTSGSTGLFSPISPQDPAFSRGEALQHIYDLLQQQKEGMPIASFAMSELPDLQYPSQPGMEEEEENRAEKSGEVDRRCDGGNVERSLDENMTVEKVEGFEAAPGQGKQKSDDEDPFAMPSPRPQLEKETRELQAKEKSQLQKSTGRKTPLFLPDSGPPSVKSMSPAPVVPVRRNDTFQVLSSLSQQPYYDHEDEGEEHRQEVKSPDSSQDIHRPLITSSEEVEVQLTTLSEIESSDESSDGEDDGEEMDELLSSHEDDVHSRSSDEIDHEENFESQLDVERTLLTESQRREDENKEFMEDVYRGESGSQIEAARMLIPESQMPDEGGGGGSVEVDEAMGDVRQEGEVEIGFESQLDVERALLPESQMQGEGTMGVIGQEIGLESQVDVERTLLPESQMQEEGTMGVIEQEIGLESEPGTQVDLPGMLIPQSQGGEEVRGDGGDESMGDVRQEAGFGGREEIEVTPHESSRDSVPSTMDANPRGDDISMTIESSIDTFTVVLDPIGSFLRMEEEGRGQGRGQEELDRQMQVDDDGSQPQFENYHHESDHLSPDLSYQNGLEKSSSGQLHNSAQSVEPNPPLENGEGELASPLSPLLPIPQLESPVELTPPPSTQVGELGTAGVMPPSPLDSMAPTSSTQARNRTQQQAEQVIPIALPEYISPVNSPSPSKSPLPVLERGRKRKFQEMRMQSLFRTLESSGGGGSGRRGEQVKQVQLVTPTRSGIEKRTSLASGGASGSTSPDGAPSASKTGSASGKRAQQSSNAAKLVTPKRNRLGLTVNTKEKNGVKKGEGRSEENPICLSSTPSTPTGEVGDEQLMSKRKGKGKEKEKEREKGSSECIDLTDSPVSRGTKAAELVEGQGSRKGKEKEKDVDKNKQRDKKEEEKRKKKEKEKKMMPVGTEDSDDAEVIPARAFKTPKAVVESTSDDESSSQQRNGKKANGTTRVPVLNLNSIRDRQNKAMTKVKRKTRFDGNAPASTQKKVVDKDEPPLKRARGRSENRDTSNAVSGAPGSKGRALRKEPAVASTSQTKWPQKGGARSSDRNFVNCDICSMWYHYGCVGVSMGDDRLRDDVNFICPPCSATGARSHNTGEGQRSKRTSTSRKNSASEICARSDCSFKDSSDGREYWVRRIVGRKVKVGGRRGRVEIYLVEWEGYRLQEATWQEEDTMGDPAELIAEFVLAARKEGIDLDRESDRTVLLKDARAVGWTADD